MGKYEEDLINEKLKLYLGKFDNPKTQSLVKMSLEGITLSASEFFEIAEKQLMEYEKETKRRCEREYNELNEEYKKLENIHKTLNEKYDLIAKKVDEIGKIIKYDFIKGKIEEIDNIIKHGKI